MAELVDINGVGPAKAETLEEAGFDSVEAIAEADQDELAAVDGVGDDRALEFIVQAADLVEDTEEEVEEVEGDEFDLKPSEVSDEVEKLDDPTDEEVEEELIELEEEIAEEEEAVEEVEEESDEPENYTVVIEFDEMLEYDVFHAAIMRRHEDVYTGRQQAADALAKVLDGLDNFDEVSYSLTEEEFNELHSAVLQQRTNYQGDNLIDHMDALKKIEEQVNEQRDELLFN